MNCADAVDERASDATIVAITARIPDERIGINVTGRGNRVEKLEPQQANCLPQDCHPSMQLRQREGCCATASGVAAMDMTDLIVVVLLVRSRQEPIGSAPAREFRIGRPPQAWNLIGSIGAPIEQSLHKPVKLEAMR
jgi:hypothetical protein